MSYRYLVQEITYNDMNYVVIYHWNHLHGFDCQANIEKLEHWNLFIFCYINKNALAYLQAPNIRNNQGSILESFQAFISVQAAEVVLPKSDLKEKFITFFSTVTKPSNSNNSFDRTKLWKLAWPDQRTFWANTQHGLT